jgi:hypothetical protein
LSFADSGTKQFTGRSSGKTPTIACRPGWLPRISKQGKPSSQIPPPHADDRHVCTPAVVCPQLVTPLGLFTQRCTISLSLATTQLTFTQVRCRQLKSHVLDRPNTLERVQQGSASTGSGELHEQHRLSYPQFPIWLFVIGQHVRYRSKFLAGLPVMKAQDFTRIQTIGTVPLIPMETGPS